MLWIHSALRDDSDSRDLLHSTSRKLIFTTLALYLAWHFIATLTWPQIFSPRLWATTLMVVALVTLTLAVVRRYYLAAQAVWLLGLAGIILHAYGAFGRPEITLLLTLLPLMAIVTVGHLGTILVLTMILAILNGLPQVANLPALPPGFEIGIGLGSIFTALFGWGLSENLLSALESSTYHYKQARKLLDETRRHRAEIARMLKDQHQANYRLERMNEMLQFARRQAEEARDDRDRFILAVSHELRSPLNFILGFSDLMVNSPDTYAPLEDWPAGLYEDVQEIYHSSTHLLGLINDILDMGQIDAQQMTIYREKSRLEDLVREVQEMVAPAFAQKGLGLRSNFAPGLPPVFVDRTRIRQVLLNLVNNSLRFTEQGGVTFHLRQENGAITVCVEDTGQGIALEDIPKVFDEFRQVGQENWRRREGSGLGLSISRRFILLHGGRMWLESELGQGARFYFTLPVMEAPRELEAFQEADLDKILQARYGRPERQEPWVVLLSSNPLAPRLIGQCLQGYQMALATHPEQLPALIEKCLPRAILVDRGMMEDSAQLVKNLAYDLPLVSFVLPHVRAQAKTLPVGVSDYLLKPIPRQDLVAAVEALGPEVRRLLVVDDDPAMLRFVTQALHAPDNGATRPLDYECLTAASGNEALACLRAQAVDAILLDLDLPDISGWEVLDQVRREAAFKQTPIIIISAADMPQLFYAGGQEILEVFLRRPLAQKELGEVLTCLLANLEPVY